MSLIKVFAAKTGDPVVRINERLTASAFDPQAEADSWVKSHSAFTSHVRTIFVLGLGSGYHIMKLLERVNARVVLIDCLIEPILRCNPMGWLNQGRVVMKNIELPRDIRFDKEICAGVSSSFLVLVHAPSIAHNPSFFFEVKRQLIAREWGVLNWQWNLVGHEPLFETTRVDATDHPLSIRDLDQTDYFHRSVSRERMLIKALRELVK